MKRAYLLPAYCGTKFKWSKNHGSIKASDIGHPVDGPRRVYNDAYDWGFVVIGNFKNILFLYTGLEINYKINCTAFTYRSECGMFEIRINN